MGLYFLAKLLPKDNAKLRIFIHREAITNASQNKMRFKAFKTHYINITTTYTAEMEEFLIILLKNDF